MTATTTTAMPQDLVERSWSSLLRVAAVVAVLVVLALGSFAFGRTTADEGGAKASIVPAASAAPSASAASCGHVAHTPPC
jgi:hypothetical protein